MEMFFLVVKIGYAIAVMPEKYTKEQCEKASKEYGYCIPAPKPTKCHNEADGPYVRMICE